MDLGLASELAPSTVTAATRPPPFFGRAAAMGGTPLYLAPERKRLLLLNSCQGESSSSSSSDDAAAAATDVVTAPHDVGSWEWDGPSPASDVYALGVVTAETFGRFATAMERAATLEAIKREAAAAPGGTHRSVSATEHGSRTPRPAASPPRLASHEADALVCAMLAPLPGKRPQVEAVEETAALLAHAANTGG